jgi:hypothetical protein
MGWPPQTLLLDPSGRASRVCRFGLPRRKTSDAGLIVGGRGRGTDLLVRQRLLGGVHRTPHGGHLQQEALNALCARALSLLSLLSLSLSLFSLSLSLLTLTQWATRRIILAKTAVMMRATRAWRTREAKVRSDMVRRQLYVG